MAIVTLFVFVSIAWGQSAAPLSPLSKAPPAVFLPKDSPHLYRLFFYYHRSFDAFIQQRKIGRAPVDVQRLDREVSSIFGLGSVDTLPVLRVVSNAFAAELMAVDEEERAHSNARAHYELGPLPSQLQAFEARRVAIVTRGIAALRTQLGPTEWTRFQTYINGAHRTSYSVVSPQR